MILKDLDRLTSPSGRIAPFVVFEGVNGAGKTTLLKKIQAKLEALGAKTLPTREPGGPTPIGKTLRTILLDPERPPIHPLTELLIYSADRAEHVTSIIRPAIDRGVFVLCDRYYFSTLAFQGHGRGLDLRTISTLSSIATTQLDPSLAILIDIDPSLALDRAKQRGEGLDAIEREGLDFHSRIREGFLSIAEESTVPFLVLDGNSTPEELCEAAFPFVEKIYHQTIRS